MHGGSTPILWVRASFYLQGWLIKLGELLGFLFLHDNKRMCGTNPTAYLNWQTYLDTIALSLWQRQCLGHELIKSDFLNGFIQKSKQTNGSDIHNDNTMISLRNFLPNDSRETGKAGLCSIQHSCHFLTYVFPVWNVRVNSQDELQHSCNQAGAC